MTSVMNATIPWEVKVDGLLLRRGLTDVTLWVSRIDGRWLAEVALDDVTQEAIGGFSNCSKAIKAACDWARENGHL